jgi:methylation protein EvaC
MTLNCRICETVIQPFMSFGEMPIANGFLNPEEFATEYFYELKPAFCENCLTFQIVEQPDPEKMFHHNYAFYSRTSKSMISHFKSFSDWIINEYLSSPDSFVVEIGSNDGAMMENFSKNKIRHLGVEPSENVANEARKYGINTLCSFFSLTTAEKITSEYGSADALIAANVICHIPDLHGVAQGAAHLLKPTGILAFEEPYLGDMIKNTAYDQIYDEHVYIFSARSVKNIFSKHGFELVDVKQQPTHGGSMRYVLARKGKRSISSNVEKQLAYEDSVNLHLKVTYDGFHQRCKLSRKDLLSALQQQKNEGKRVVGYAATSKSTTVLNYCGIGSDLIEFISDTTPIKQGKYSPGVHIPIRPYEDLQKLYPETLLLFAWNHKREVMKNESTFLDEGGTWITYIPKVTLIRK